MLWLTALPHRREHWSVSLDPYSAPASREEGVPQVSLPSMPRRIVEGLRWLRTAPGACLLAGGPIVLHWEIVRRAIDAESPLAYVPREAFTLTALPIVLLVFSGQQAREPLASTLSRAGAAYSAGGA